MRRLTLLFLLLLAAPAHALRVTAPVEVVPAHPLAASVAAEIEVTGRAARGAVVRVRATCELGPCAATAVANRHRRFTAQLNVVVPADRQDLRLRVRSGTREVDRTVALDSTPNDVTGPELVVVGDSLAIGTEYGLRNDLPGWRVTSDGRAGRPLAEGMAVLDMTLLDPRPDVLAFSLFTNDDPRNVDALEVAVRRSLDEAPCVLWATVVRPPVAGLTYRRANARLRALAEEDDRLRIVDWNAAVKRHRSWLSPDGVHPNPTGYAARAQLYADAALGCLSKL